MNTSTTITQAPKAFPFDFKADLWKHYLQNRPSYPEALWHEWIEYHQGPLDTAHDLGTGCGIGAASLLAASYRKGRPIKHMILSDPFESNITTAKGLLEAGDYPNSKLSFHQKKGEDSFLEPGSVDMTIACECLHFTDIDKAMASIHASLRPGGTVASVFYGVINARIRGNERADAAWRAFNLMHSRRIAEEKLETILTHVKGPQKGLGLNFVPLDRNLWQDVRRIFVNMPDGKTEWRAPVGRPANAGSSTNSKEPGSRIDPDYDSLEWRGDPDGWAIKECTAEKIKETLMSMLLRHDDKDWQSDEWREFEAAVKEGGGTVHFVICATMILARKK
jgi:trans-aconitate 3-methyltransferase